MYKTGLRGWHNLAWSVTINHCVQNCTYAVGNRLRPRPAREDDGWSIVQLVTRQSCTAWTSSEPCCNIQSQMNLLWTGYHVFAGHNPQFIPSTCKLYLKLLIKIQCTVKTLRNTAESHCWKILTRNWIFVLINTIAHKHSIQHFVWQDKYSFFFGLCYNC